jgi:peptidoglycan pentaglycine glycine transferase (the first glycine)
VAAAVAGKVHPLYDVEQTAWDEAVLARGGHLLQSWRWGAFKAQFGWHVERVVARSGEDISLAQILFRHRAGVSIGYIPRGPVLPSGDLHAARELRAQIDRVARCRRALTIIVEPDQPFPAEVADELRLQPGPAPIQPSRTVKVDLLDDTGLLAQMHPKMRYNVRLAQRRGVVIRRVGDAVAASDEFYALLRDTAARNEFIIHTPEYYRAFLRLFGDDIALLFADVEGRVAAAAVAVAFGDEAIYMYGASSTQDRGHGAAFLLQFEAMRWARERGCLRYDLWGIPEQDPETSRHQDGDRLVSTSGSDRRGLYEFKTRFGGQIVSYPRPLERRYAPILATLARRFCNPGG